MLKLNFWYQDSDCEGNFVEVVFVRNHCEGILREADREGNAETVYLSSSRILVRSVSDGT